MAKPALTVGFLVDTLAEDYQRRIFAGLTEEALRLNLGVVCFVGGPLVAAGPSVHRNRIYECISSTNIDALVVTTGTLGNKVGEETLAAFVESYRPLPICSVGIELPAIPSVTVDNRGGARQALEHLIEEAGRRRVAFIRGPESNREAEERFLVYRDVLHEHRIAVNPDLVTTGDFEAPSGAQAVATLIDERHMGFDAIMAASDLMALGAMNALIERGVSVPERVNVVGFDDVEAARFASSPLTTIRQPLRELGRRSLENVVAQFYSAATEERLVLPAELIARNSTSTRRTREPAVDVSSSLEVVDSTSFETAYHEIRESLFEELRRLLSDSHLDKDWPEQLVGALVGEVSGRRAGLLKRTTFLEYLEQMLLQVMGNECDAGNCQQLVSVLRQRFGNLVRHSPLLQETAESLFHQARILIGSIAERYQVQQRLLTRHWRRVVQDVGAILLRCNSLAALNSRLASELPRIGIPACVLCAFEESGTSRVCGGFDHDRIFDGVSEPFPLHELYPPGLLDPERRRTLIVETLYLQDRAIGYVVFEMGPTEPEIYDLLRDYLTGSLRDFSLKEPHGRASGSS